MASRCASVPARDTAASDANSVRTTDQPALAELPVSLQPQNIRPPSALPLLADDDPSGSIKHYFLTGFSVASLEQLRHLH